MKKLSSIHGKNAPSALTTLWPLLGRPVALHRGLVDLCGGVKTALMLSQAIYWTRKGVDITNRNGWFHKRQEDWLLEIGLGRRSQERAREHLIAMGIMEQRLYGLPAKLEFRINLQQLAQCLSNEAKPMHDLMSLFGTPLAFHSSLANLIHSVTAGLLLSHLLHLTRRCVLEGVTHFTDMPWITLTTVKWMANTGLSRREFDHARDQLRSLSLITERLRGIPPILEMRVEIMVLGDRLNQQIPSKIIENSNLYVLDNQECGNPAISVPDMEQTSLSKTYKLDWPERINQHDQNVQNSLAESAKTLINRTTELSLLQPPTLVDISQQAIQPSGGGKITSLIYPNALTSLEKKAIDQLLVNVSQEAAQSILDELEGRLHRVGATGIPNRVGYVRRLRDLHLTGGFVPEAALIIQEGRLQRAEEQARYAAQKQEDAKYAAIEATPEAREKGARALSQIKATLGIAERSI